MGLDGAPQGVEILSTAARVKEGRFCIPVPPMTAICTGSTKRKLCFSRNVPVRTRRPCGVAEERIYSGIPLYSVTTVGAILRLRCPSKQRNLENSEVEARDGRKQCLPRYR